MPGVHSKAEPRRMPWWQRAGAVSWLVVVARLLVGGVFVFAGMSKLALPHGEVVAQMQQYTIIPRLLTPLIATVLPWVEVLSGAALLIGFLTSPAAWLVVAQLVSFCLLMLVVLAAGIEVEDCGCFGALGWKETPLQVLLRDLVMLALMWPVVTRHRDVGSVDGWGQSLENAEDADA
jgi:putative oxidoreductase